MSDKHANSADNPKPKRSRPRRPRASGEGNRNATGNASVNTNGSARGSARGSAGGAAVGAAGEEEKRDARRARRRAKRTGDSDAAPVARTSRRAASRNAKSPAKAGADAAPRGEPLDGKRVVKLTGRSGGKLLDPAVSFAALPDDPIISPELVRRYKLVDGAQVAGRVATNRNGVRELVSVERINGLTPEDFQARTPFERLVAIDPADRFALSGGSRELRVVDLVAPIAKGSRVLIAAPPKCGKTGLLAGLAHAIHADDPEVRLIMLLIDERPEEVTHFRRTVPAEILASSSDQSTAEHVELAELTLAMIRCELECGRDVVVLVDSLTRLARAVNLQGRGTRRTLSGGVDAGALEMPRRFFGLARNIEHGGSVTVVGTALIDTGSQMDDLLYEEFKATGNCEIVLDRELAEARLFPAVSIPDSGTRREELLFDEAEMARLTKLRRWLAGGSPKAALTALLKLVDQTEDNEELLARIRV